MFVEAAIICLYLWLLYYLVNLQKTNCTCALNKKRQWIIGFVCFSIVVNMYSFITRKTFLDNVALWLVYGLVVLVNLVVMFQYVYYLKKDRCVCSEGDARSVITMIAIFQAVFLGIALYMFVILYPLLQKKKR